MPEGHHQHATSLSSKWGCVVFRGRSSAGLQLHNATKLISVTLSPDNLRLQSQTQEENPWCHVTQSYADDTLDSPGRRARTGRKWKSWSCGVETATSTAMPRRPRRWLWISLPLPSKFMFRDVADSLHRTELNMQVWKGLHPAFIAFEEQKNIIFAESSKLNTTESKSARPPAIDRSLLLLYHVN